MQVWIEQKSLAEPLDDDPASEPFHDQPPAEAVDAPASAGGLSPRKMRFERVAQTAPIANPQRAMNPEEARPTFRSCFNTGEVVPRGVELEVAVLPPSSAAAGSV